MTRIIDTNVFTIRTTTIEGCCVATSIPSADTRGDFGRFFCARELGFLVQNRAIQQINRSRTFAVGTVRGLHAQKAPALEYKLVRCIAGRVWDVVVDLRRGSSSYCRWESFELSGTSHDMVIIPEGCAHGFQTLAQSSELLYLHTAEYDKAAEFGVNYADAALNINWPLPIAMISDRDRSLPFIDDMFGGIKT